MRPNPQQILLIVLSIFASLCYSETQSTCYSRDGSTIQVNYYPCNFTTNGAHSACCDSTAPCSLSGLCYGSAGFLYRGGCTDPSWESPACAGNICTDGDTSSYVNLMSCEGSTHTFCCDYDGTGCCFGVGSSPNFTGFYPGFPYFPDLSSGEPIASSTPTVTSIVTVTSTSVPTVTTSSSSLATVSHGVSTRTIGLVVGIPLGVITIALLAILLYRERKGKNERKTAVNIQPGQQYNLVGQNKQQYYEHQIPGYPAVPQLHGYQRPRELDSQRINELH